MYILLLTTFRCIRNSHFIYSLNLYNSKKIESLQNITECKNSLHFNETSNNQ